MARVTIFSIRACTGNRSTPKNTVTNSTIPPLGITTSGGRFPTNFSWAAWRRRSISRLETMSRSPGKQLTDLSKVPLDLVKGPNLEAQLEEQFRRRQPDPRRRVVKKVLDR